MTPTVDCTQPAQIELPLQSKAGTARASRPESVYASARTPIVIQRTRDLYGAEVTPPHRGANHWLSAQAMNRDDLIAALRRLGCHQTDIADAFYEADPAWLEH